MIPQYEQVKSEVAFSTARSGGPGGQNVNKVSSKVILRWDIFNSVVLGLDQKEIILDKLKTKLSGDGILVLTSQESRSQLENKESAIRKLNTLLWKAFQKPKPRKKTKPTKTSKQKRAKEKQLKSEKKRWRQRPDL